eukprot:CAMPEP_0201281582 /NCGR_PEP_ID=MMETSP1317-20130820/3415_1 /ASSEMBLY_ACC=CAM_ASM_000770 /TAXON_ID=187299 /ORGANISM="Undescribed Undescribed, Strain Undescribed" /LENGTH=155 /DNA_ID=CAMNT_0047591827 /DNA_START=1484 /DNA_END=1951 /DNA_ORIENTATION=-
MKRWKDACNWKMILLKKWMFQWIMRASIGYQIGFWRWKFSKIGHPISRFTILFRRATFTYRRLELKSLQYGLTNLTIYAKATSLYKQPEMAHRITERYTPKLRGLIGIEEGDEIERTEWSYLADPTMLLLERLRQYSIVALNEIVSRTLRQTMFK